MKEGLLIRNPPQNYAGKLIESCGLKGGRIGDAVVSEKHANFVINDRGEASANDIETLIQLVQNTVEDQTTVPLFR